MKDDIYIVGSTAHSLINFRYELIKSIQKSNSITVFSQDYSYQTKKKFKKIKVNYISYGFKSFFLINEIITLLKIVKFFFLKKKIKVISYTLRGNVYVGIANLFNRNIKHFPMITGLGGIFLSKNDSFTNYLAYFFFKYLLKISLSFSETIIFQNNDDKKYFDLNILNKEALVVPGSGVNLRLYNQVMLPKKITFMMISRMIKNKGIENFFYVANKISKMNKKIQFVFVGNYQKKFSLNKNFSSLKREFKNVKILKWTKSGKHLYKNCSVYVLPSKREGMSRTILEAMSSGRAIITTNVPGCKETVKNGHNGFLINYNDNLSLFKAINKFVENPDLIKLFGLNSRKRAINLFDVNIVNKKIIKLLDKK